MGAAAESDCSLCLELDAAHIKALFRRGLARKALKKYRLALRDFEAALKIEPENRAALKQKKAMAQKLQSMLKRSKERQFGSAAPKNSTQSKSEGMRRIVIEECDSDSDDSDSINGDSVEAKTDAREDFEEVKEETIVQRKNASMGKIEIEATPFTMNAKNLPTHFIGFEKLWNRASTVENRATVLLAMNSANLKMERVIKNMMDEVLFSQMIGAVHFIGMERDAADALRILKSLTKLERFEMIVMFMEPSDQTLLSELKRKCAECRLTTAVFKHFE